MKIKACLALSLLILSGCNCKSPAIKVIEPVNAKTDPFLSCGQLKFAVAEAEYFLRAADRKEEKPEAYAGSPMCLLSIQFTTIQAQEAAKDRIDYLSTLMREKKCSSIKPVISPIKDKDQELIKLPVKK